MARPDGRVQPGQRLDTAFSARAWNRAQDAADLVLKDRGGLEVGDASSTPRGSNIIVVKNLSSQDVDRFHVLGIEVSIGINPTSSSSAAASFSERPVFEGFDPRLETLTRFAICIEPIKRLSWGRAIIGGTFACKVRVNDVNHHFAVALPGDTTQLQSTTCGPVWLAWKDTAGWSLATRDNRWAAGVM